MTKNFYISSKLILLRHGQSIWNQENKFTGFVDVELSKIGINEAVKAGKVLKKNKIHTDILYTSVLKRAINTAQITLNILGNFERKIIRDKALNERHYGDLQGLYKDDVLAKYGEAQFLAWRRGYTVRPPGGESLKDTYDRVIPYYLKEIEPNLQAGKNVLIVAHGNSLRALLKMLLKISDQKIVKLNIPTGKLICIEFDSNGCVKSQKYLTDTGTPKLNFDR